MCSCYQAPGSESPCWHRCQLQNTGVLLMADRCPKPPVSPELSESPCGLTSTPASPVASWYPSALDREACIRTPLYFSSSISSVLSDPQIKSHFLLQSFPPFSARRNKHLCSPLITPVFLSQLVSDILIVQSEGYSAPALEHHTHYCWIEAWEEVIGNVGTDFMHHVTK